jgi:hypothetical protein
VPLVVLDARSERRCRRAGWRLNGAGRAELVDEPAARLVVAGVGPEKALVTACKLLGAIRIQWLEALVMVAAASLGVEVTVEPGVAGKSRSELVDVNAKRQCGVTDGLIDQTDVSGVLCSEWCERRASESRGELASEPAGEQIGPVFGAVEPAHVLVVGVQNGVTARQHVIGCERQRYSSGGGVADQRRDHEVGVSVDDLAHKIIDRVEVAP